MKGIQVFASFDPLKDYKVSLLKKYNCIFLEHNTNTKTTINCGMKMIDMYHEKIITDGNINIIDRCKSKPGIVWREEYFTLDTGLALSIEITDSTFYVNRICKNNEVFYEIHMNNESRLLIDYIVNYIYGDRHNINTNSLSVFYPDTIKEINYQDNIKTEQHYFYSDRNHMIKKKKKIK